MPLVKISSKGQIIIPKEVRLKLGLKPKGYARITLMEENKKATIEAVSDDPINRLTGIFKDYTNFSTKELLKSRKMDLNLYVYTGCLNLNKNIRLWTMLTMIRAL